MSHDEFTLVSTSSNHKLYDDFEEIESGKLASLHTSILAALRREYPELCITVTLASNVNLVQFAAFGNAVAELDTLSDSVQRLRVFLRGNDRRGIPDQLADSRSFAKYQYQWGTEYFLVYTIQIGFYMFQYIIKEPGEGETIISQPSCTDALINAVGKWQKPSDRYVYVFDGYWMASRPLYDEVQKAKWDDVILNEEMKTDLVELMQKFFDSKDIYDDLGVPWKRGVIFHGPAGNGKTISIKALMHSLSQREQSIPSLYVKAAPQTWNIRSVFAFARSMSPCFLILEDIDTIVTPATRSYFFNEVDGLENNDGIFMVATTNHLDQLDPGLSSRPSRFDRKYLFPLPDDAERVLYCNYWRLKLRGNPSIRFPKRLCIAIAGITQEFSFAYLKEAFVATLLTMARRRTENSGGASGGGDDDDLDDYELWVEMKKTVKILREDMGTRRKRTAFGHIVGAAAPHPVALPAPAPIAQQDVAGFETLPIRQGLPSQGLCQQRPAVPTEIQKSRAGEDQPWTVSSLINDKGEVLDWSADQLGSISTGF